MRRITKTPWFGPKKYAGWGWRITSWQGAVVTVAVVALVAVAGVTMHAWSIPIVVVLVVLYLVVALLTGDPPGGPRRAEDSSGSSGQ